MKLKKTALIAVLLLGSVIITLMLPAWSRGPIAQALDRMATQWGMQYRSWFRMQQGSSFPVLLGLAFGGGLVASFSPCILSLLPINLSYIGTREIQSRRDALMKATAFVLGVVTILSLFGVFSSFAGFVLIQFSGYFHLTIGILILLMGLALSELIRLPRMPQWLQLRTDQLGFDSRGSQWVQGLLAGPYGMGLTFALVSSPCSSPIMFSILSIAATLNSQLQSVLIMVSYSLGYTAVIFFASLFAGLVKQTRGLLKYADRITQIASFSLLMVGGFYIINGGQWIVSKLK